MFQRLKDKWQVSWLQFTIIFCTFALGGSLCGYAGRKLLALGGLDKTNGFLYVPIYIIFVTLLWPLCVLIVSIPLGQFTFFRNYLRKMGRRMRPSAGTKPSMRGSAGKSYLRSSAIAESSTRDSAETHGVSASHTHEVPAVHSHEVSAVHPHEAPTVHTHEVSAESLVEDSAAAAATHTGIAIFASGAGSNAEKIIGYLKGHTSIKVNLIVCNKPGAGVLRIAEANAIPVLLIEKEQFFRGNAYVDELKQHNVSFVVLAGFLWKVPPALINAFPNRIINIHPALLPKYGGKGMYGAKVHEAVIAAGEKESGITIHYVNEHFDEGEHIFQATCTLDETDTAETLAQKIHALEHAHFPEQVEKAVAKIRHA